MLADFGQMVGQYLIPGLIILFFFAVIIILKVMVGRYQKIPPNKVAIIYGRGTKVSGEGQIQGCKVVSGGGVLVWPVFQEIDFMDTAAFKMAINEANIPNKDNVKINVGGVAVCKISTTPEDLQNAAMSFLGQKQEQIQETISSLLIGHLRSIIGKLDIDSILRDRDAFNKMVVNESTPELKRMGIQIVTLVIQEVSDGHGYIDALGEKTVAEAKRDAKIKVAQAEAETEPQHLHLRHRLPGERHRGQRPTEGQDHRGQRRQPPQVAHGRTSSTCGSGKLSAFLSKVTTYRTPCACSQAGAGSSLAASISRALVIRHWPVLT